MIRDYEQYGTPAKHMLKKIAAELNAPEDLLQAVWITRSVFMAIRDVISLDDSVKLIERLPEDIRMLYTDGWDRSISRKRYETAENFYNAVRNHSETLPLDFFDDTQTRQVIQAVFKVLRTTVDAELLDEIKDQLPSALAASV
ncbi:MAG TPA: DUF2267 domain-containing protein [Chryseosolibacter sp.]|nr:DUF2267 domain-containing protein [Chryseosolibacter sp.]